MIWNPKVTKKDDFTLQIELFDDAVASKKQCEIFIELVGLDFEQFAFEKMNEQLLLEVNSKLQENIKEYDKTHIVSLKETICNL